MHHGCFFSVPKVALHHSLEVVAGFRLKDWPGHKPSRAPSLEVHLARRQANIKEHLSAA